MITGWLSEEDCPRCGGPLLETSDPPGPVTLACPGCGHTATRPAPAPGPERESGRGAGAPDDPCDLEAE